MDLQSLAAVGEIVGGAAVVVTLVLLIVSMRQSTKAQRAVAVDSLAAAIAAINVPAIESAHVGSAIARATADWTAASREDRIIAHYFLFSFFKLTENAWYQRREMILDERLWEGWSMLLRKYFHSKGIREVWWPARRHAYSVEFQEYLAGTVPPIELGNLSDIFETSTATEATA